MNSWIQGKTVMIETEALFISEPTSSILEEQSSSWTWKSEEDKSKRRRLY